MGVRSLFLPNQTVNAVVNQEVLEHFTILTAEMIFANKDVIFPQDLAPVHRLWWLAAQDIVV